MKRARVYLPLIVFALVLTGHATSWTIRNDACAVGCAETCPPGDAAAGRLRSYVSQQDYMVGLSYALAGAFTLYALLTFIQSRKRGAGGIVGGSVLMAGIYGAVCFFTGCCGSPMLVIYIGLFGASALGFAKPLILLVTVVSIALGFLWMRRRAACPVKCPEPGSMKKEQK